ncbi:MAG: DUF4434 domain-containing protein [Lentisphaeria bacterium]|nr:DUF4434 domain-containing protein [Lentisphaeria bacterium]
MRITATFLDEISHDIPHQNWGLEEWDRDFQAMKAIGIDTVVLIRCGWKRQITFPSEVLKREKSAFKPSIDLIGMFLYLAEKYGMKFFCGTYDSGNPWWHDDYQVEPEVQLMTEVNDEIWAKYGKSPAFAGWYLSQEIAGDDTHATECYRKMARHLKDMSGNLPILISPGIKGAKAYNENMEKLGKTIDPADHEAQWDKIMKSLQGLVDIIAFQDGHVEIELLPIFLKINKKLCDKYGIDCWTNTESFDRDMPIDFFPIKWDKLRCKLEAAEEAGLSRAMTFEFSHFMSPNSCYIQAHGLYKRYQEYINGEKKEFYL